MTKANEHFDFKFVKFYDIDEIGYSLKEFKNQWLKDTSRQEIHNVHKNTMSYFIYENSNHSLASNKHTKLVCDNANILNLVTPIIKDLEITYDGKISQALFIKLPPSAEILPHEDQGTYVEAVRRFHIPIVTNPDVKFNVDGEIKYLKHGECWEINNNKVHHVINKGDEDRIHLMIDIMPNKFLDN